MLDFSSPRSSALVYYIERVDRFKNSSRTIHGCTLNPNQGYNYVLLMKFHTFTENAVFTQMPRERETMMCEKNEY